jgi:hypothetical protein
MSNDKGAQAPKSNAGGARAGAGRPTINPLLRKSPATVKLPQWLLDWMREQDEAQSVLIEQAMIKTYKLKPWCDAGS